MLEKSLKNFDGRMKERNVLFNDALNTFYLRLYDIGGSTSGSAKGGNERGGRHLYRGANFACKSISTTSIGRGGYIFDPGQQYPPPPPAPHI